MVKGLRRLPFTEESRVRFPLVVHSYCSLTYKEKQIMETLFFILGIASVVVIASAIVAVVSIVKVTKLQKRANDEGSGLQQSIDALYRALDDNIRNNNRNLDIVQDHFSSQLDSRLDKLESKLTNNKK